ncbi:MAG: FMN-binding protein [Kineosporiaceae bacterium]
MRRIAIGFMSTVSGLVLLFSYHTSTSSGGTAVADAGSATSGNASGGTSSGSSSGTSSGTSSGASSGASSGSATSGTFTGDAVTTRWGIVQVEITVENGKITRSEAVRFPQGNQRDVEINSYAVPILDDAAVQAQSANLDGISGATVTWGGYTQSLQSAIDQARL